MVGDCICALEEFPQSVALERLGCVDPHLMHGGSSPAHGLNADEPPCPGDLGAKIGKTRPMSAQIWPEIDHIRPKVARNQPDLSDFGQCWPEVDQVWSEFGQLQPTLARKRPNLPRIRPNHDQDNDDGVGVGDDDDCDHNGKNDDSRMFSKKQDGSMCHLSVRPHHWPHRRMGGSVPPRLPWGGRMCASMICSAPSCGVPLRPCFLAWLIAGLRGPISRRPISYHAQLLNSSSMLRHGTTLGFRRQTLVDASGAMGRRSSRETQVG